MSIQKGKGARRSPAASRTQAASEDMNSTELEAAAAQLRINALKHVDELRSDIELGRPGMLKEALHACLVVGAEAPEWLLLAFEKATLRAPDILHSSEKAVSLLLGDVDGLMRLRSRLQIEALRADIEKGESLAIVRAMMLCIEADFDIPPWVATAFSTAISPVLEGKDDSWDSALGRPYKRHTHLTTRALHKSLEGLVMLTVFDALREDPTLNIQRESLFEEVATRVGNHPGIGSSVVEKIYRSALATGRFFNAEELRLKLLGKVPPVKT